MSYVFVSFDVYNRFGLFLFVSFCCYIRIIRMFVFKIKISYESDTIVLLINDYENVHKVSLN